MDSSNQDTLLLDTSGVYKPTVVPQGIPEKNPQSTKNTTAGGLRQYGTALTVNLLTLSAGCVYGWASPAGPQIESNNSPIGDQVSEEDVSWLAAVPFLSGLCGTFVFGVLADALGRKKAGIIGAFPFIASWLMIALCDGLPALYVARILAGVGAGGSIVVSPMFVGETASENLRGKLGTFPAVAINSGIVLSFIVGALLPYHRFSLTMLILPIALIVCLIRIPDTPPYLLKKGKQNDAYKSLEWFRGGRRTTAIDDELDLLKDAADRNASKKSVSINDFLCHTGTRRALIVNMGLVINQQFCGVIAILNYTELIFKESGSSLSSTLSSIIVGLLQAICTYLSSRYINSFKRKTLLAWSNIVMGTCIATLGVFFYAKKLNYDTSMIGWLPVVCLSMYIMAFAFGIGPVPMVIMAETFSIRVRSLATSTVMSCQLISAFICTKAFTQISGALGIHGVLFLFGGCCALGILFVVFYVIETEGKTLQDILLEYNGERKQTETDVYESVTGKKMPSDAVMNKINIGKDEMLESV